MVSNEWKKKMRSFYIEFKLWLSIYFSFILSFFLFLRLLFYAVSVRFDGNVVFQWKTKMKSKTELTQTNNNGLHLMRPPQNYSIQGGRRHLIERLLQLDALLALLHKISYKFDIGSKANTKQMVAISFRHFCFDFIQVVWNVIYIKWQCGCCSCFILYK